MTEDKFQSFESPAPQSQPQEGGTGASSTFGSPAPQGPQGAGSGGGYASFGTPPSAGQPPVGGGPQEPGTPPPFSPSTPSPTPPQGGEQSGKALASLIAGILSWFLLFFIGGIAAVILGHLALREIRESGGRLEGETLAKVGLGLGYANVILTTLCACCIALFFLLTAMGENGLSALWTVLA